MRKWIALLFLIAVTSPSCAQEHDPCFRHTNYIAFVAEVGGSVNIRLTGVQIGSYADPLRYRVLDSTSDVVETGEIRPGGEKAMVFTPKTAGLHVLEIDSGWNGVTANLTVPHAIVSHEGVVVKTRGRLPPLYFYVPTGAKQFTIHLQASVTGEGLAYKILDPGGNVASEGQGDYDRFEKVKVDVPAGADGKAWFLSILRPTQPGIGLDDTEIYLGKELAPYLAGKPEWAVTFGTRKHP